MSIGYWATQYSIGLLGSIGSISLFGSIGLFGTIGRIGNIGQIGTIANRGHIGHIGHICALWGPLWPRYLASVEAFLDRDIWRDIWPLWTAIIKPLLGLPLGPRFGRMPYLPKS